MVIDVTIFICVEEFEGFFYFVTLFVGDFLADGGGVAGVGGMELRAG